MIINFQPQKREVRDVVAVPVVCNGIIGFGIDLNYFDPEKYVDNIKKLKKVRQKLGEILQTELPDKFAVLDIPPNDRLIRLINFLQSQDFVFERIYDEHVDPKNQKEVKNVELIKQMLDDKACLVSRSLKHPSSTSLVPEGIFKSEQIDFVFFDADADGFLAFLKGCGESNTYERLVEDANIIDHGSQNGFNHLSTKGCVLNDAFQVMVLPAWRYPEEAQDAKKRLFNFFLEWIRSGYTEHVKSYIKELEAARENARQNAEELAKQTKLYGGRVVMADMRSIFDRKEFVLNRVWKANLSKKHGRVLFCLRNRGLTGDIVHVSLPQQWQKTIDIRDILPGFGHCSFRMEFPEELWPRFYENWVIKGYKKIS